MTNAIKVLLQIQSGFLQLESTISFIRRLQRLQSFTMPEYSMEEYADMHFLYGECSGNANACVRRYNLLGTPKFAEQRSSTLLSSH
jgi:hypothetical protein